MKNYSILLMIILTFSLASFSYVDPLPSENKNQQQEANQIDMPDNVQSVLTRSCLPCHDAKGSGKARVKWKYEKMSEYSKSKLISKYIKIFEKVDEGKMPPAKDVKKHPERNLSAEDKDLLKSWAENAAVLLAGESE